jgi:SAM-dependent methyltransferase
MQANRAFMRRAVRFAVDRGITQFLDVGSGIPTFGNVHEVAQKAEPEARVVYVDHDPVAVAHSRAVLEGNDRAGISAADLREPKEILNSPEVAELLDLERPVALLLIAVLHFIEEQEDPYAAVAELRDALAPGSLLLITHASIDGIPGGPECAEEAVGVYRDTRSPLVLRSHDDITRFFDGFELVKPGLVSMPLWRPESPLDQEDPYAFSGYAGVGSKA